MIAKQFPNKKDARNHHGRLYPGDTLRSNTVPVH